MAASSVSLRKNGNSRVLSLKTEFFTINKYLIRYTARLGKILADDRWAKYCADLGEAYDSDLERMEKVIVQCRSDFAAARSAAKEGMDE